MRYKILFFFFIIVVLAPFSLNAEPAYPFPVKVTQPDGTVITIILKGDEIASWAETLDGYTLLNNGKNGWEYAILDNNSNLIASGIIAHETSKQSIKEQKTIKEIKKKLRFSDIQIKQLNVDFNTRTGADKLIGTGSFIKPKSSSSNDGRRKVFSPNNTKKLLMILVDFSDKPFIKTQQNFSNLMNTPGYNQNGAQGSVRDYFLENSYGKFDITTDVVGPYRLPKTHDYYGADGTDGTHDVNFKEFILDAVKAANDAGQKFAQYDSDSDGVVDGVYVVFSGWSQAHSGVVNDIWSKAGTISYTASDGTKVGSVSCSNELLYQSYDHQGLATIGVICHEFGHVCGAPDYYDTNYDTEGQYSGTGKWDVMCGGNNNGSSYNLSGNVPAHFNPYTKMRFGWITPVEISTSGTYTLNDITSGTANVYKINTQTPNEYYLLENRQQSMFNSYIPGHGLMIYHKDDRSYMRNEAGNNNTHPQSFYLVSANATTATPTSDPDSYGTVNSSTCPFAGSGTKTVFYDNGIPSAKSWAGENTNMPITNIVEGNGIISFKVTAVNSCSSAPSTQSASLSVVPTATTLNLSWTRGNGDKVIVLAKESSVDFNPINGASFTANAIFKSGEDVGNGNYAVYNGTGNSVTVTGLNPGNTYNFAVYEYNSTDNCYLTPALTGTGTTTDVMWTGATDTDWFKASNWEAGSVPTAATSVIIPSTPTNKPQINAEGAVCKNITIQSSSSLTMNGTTAYTVSVAGDWINNGTFNAGLGTVDFNGTNDLQTISGTSTTTFNILKVTKGAQAKILEATSLIGLSGAANPLVIKSGTFKLSSASAIKPFTSSVTIGSNAGFWNNGGTITGGNFSWTLNPGLLKISAGTVNVGTSSGNGITYLNGGSIVIEGGALNVAGRISPNSETSTGSYTQSGGILTVNTIGSTSATRAPFELNAIVPFTMSGGSIVVQNSSSNATADIIILSTTNSVTGGTLQIGNSSTQSGKIIRINSTVPIWNLAVNGTGSPIAKIVTNNLSVLNDVSIASGSVLQVSPLVGLTVGGTFTNNAGTSGFVLQSNINGTATFRNTGSTNSTIPATVQQYLSTGRDWYVAAPVAGATSTTFNIGANQMAYYNEQAIQNPKYEFITDNATPLIVGTGYVIHNLIGSEYAFANMLNDGEITVNPTRTGTTAAKRGFNLIGNPYPSFLNWNAVTKTNVLSTIWYRTQAVGGSMTFDTYNGIIGTDNGEKGAVSQFIPPMQAFWIKVDKDGQSGTLVFNNNMRSHQNQNIATNRLRVSGNASEIQLIRLKVSNDLNTDETILLATNQAMDGLDATDAPKMSNQNLDIPEIYTLCNDEELVINCMNNFDISKVTALGFRTGKAGSFHIIATDISNLPDDIKVVLVDNYNQSETILNTNDSYTFYSEVEATNNRFSIKFKSASIATGLISNGNPFCVFKTLDKKIVVSCNEEKIPSESNAFLYNAFGQQISNMKIMGNRTVVADNLNPGVYFVKINQGVYISTWKIIVN